MPSTKNKNQTANNTFRRRRPRSYWFLVVLAVLLVAGVAGYGVWHYENSKAIAADRARFAQAGKDVQAVAAVIQKAYPPQKQTYTRSCEYGSHEFEKPPITCSIMFRAAYIVNDSDQANQLSTGINGLLNDKSVGLQLINDSVAHKIPTTFKTLSAANGSDEGTSEAYTDKVSNLNCTVAYDYFDASNAPIFIRSFITPKSNQNIVLTIECYGDVVNKIF